MAVTPPRIPGLDEWRPLARGGFALVWQARQQTLDRQVAVKVDERPLTNEAERRRFLREAGAAGRMSGHPGIVTVHDAGILLDDRPYLVMEFCPDGSLTRWLDPEHRPSEERVRQVGVQLADALASAHARGVLHRDVKPANVLVDSYGNVGLADFGLAMVPGPDTALTDEVLEALTPAYAPPEALRMEPATEAGDVFSLAATLYAVLAGRPPRDVDTHTQTVAEVVETVAEPIAPLPDVHPGLMAVLLQALDDDPARRPSAAQFRDALAALDLRSDRGSSPAAVPARPRRRRAALIAGVLAVAAVALAVAGLLTQLRAPAAVDPLPGDASPRAPASEPAPSAGPASSAAAPTPTGPPRDPPSSPVALPDGFVDCSEDFGKTAACPTTPECWNGIFSYQDALRQLPLVSCTDPHVYQTFLAGVATEPARSQSQLDDDRRVRRLCTRDNLDALLVGEEVTDAWEVFAVPPQPDTDDDLFRCVAGRGERDFPFELRD